MGFLCHSETAFRVKAILQGRPLKTALFYMTFILSNHKEHKRKKDFKNQLNESILYFYALNVQNNNAREQLND